MRQSLRLLGIVFFFFCQYICIPERGLSVPDGSQIKEPKKETFLLDFKNHQKEPKNFRSTWKNISRIPSHISTKGLENLYISGGHDFSHSELEAILNGNPEIKAVVDVRQETHFLVDGNSVTRFSRGNVGNKGLTESQIFQKEKILFEKLREKPSLTLYDETSNRDPQLTTRPLIFEQPAILSEEALVKDKGLFYIRLFVSDGRAPTPDEVDRFITFARTVPPKTGLYFHCREGHGRTTTFMAVYDMMKNAKNVSFEDILNRQYYLGGWNLLNTKIEGHVNTHRSQNLAFLRQFYEYARNNTDEFSTSWTTYLQNTH